MLFLSCFIHWKSILYCFSSLALGGVERGPFIPRSFHLPTSSLPSPIICLLSREAKGSVCPHGLYHPWSSYKTRVQSAIQSVTEPELKSILSISQSVSQLVKRDWNRSEHTGGDWYMIKIESENLKHQKQHRFGLIWIEKMTCFVFSLYFWLAKSTKSTFGFCFKFSGGHPPPTMIRYFPKVPTPPWSDWDCPFGFTLPMYYNYVCYWYWQ